MQTSLIVRRPSLWGGEKPAWKTWGVWATWIGDWAQLFSKGREWIVQRRRRECVNVCLCDRQGGQARVRDIKSPGSWRDSEDFGDSWSLLSKQAHSEKRPVLYRQPLLMCVSPSLRIFQIINDTLIIPVCRYVSTHWPPLGLCSVLACLNSCSSFAVLHSFYQQRRKLTFQGFPKRLNPDELSNWGRQGFHPNPVNSCSRFKLRLLRLLYIL